MYTTSAALRRPRKKGFSLIELAVVLVVLGLVASIAVPTFQQAVERSQDHAAVVEQEAVAREVNVLIAMEVDPLDALDAALADISAASPGVTAAVTYTLAAPSAEDPLVSEPATDTTEVAWAVADGRLGWATWRSAAKGVKCRVPVTGGSSQCWMSTSTASGEIAVAGPDADPGASGDVEEEGNLDNDGGGPVTIPATTTTSTATTTIPAPAAPAGLVAAAGDKAVTLTWNVSGGANGYTVYKGTSNSFAAATSASSPVGTTTTLTGLTNGTPYWFWVVAVGAGGTSGPSASVTATPKAPGVFLRQGGTVMQSSSDGLNWSTYGTAHGVSSAGWVSVVDGTIVIGSTAGSVKAKASTDNGQSWTSTDSGDFPGDGHNAGAGRIGSALYLYGSNNNNMKSSSTWTGAWNWKWYLSSPVRDVAVNGNGVGVAATSGGLRRLTEAGYTNPANTSGGWSAVAWDGARFVAIPASTGNWKASTDGTSWTNLSRASGHLSSAIKGSGGTLIAVVNGVVTRSTNGGSSWTEVTSSLSGAVSPDIVTDGNGRWIVSGNKSGAKHVFSSDDGVTWSAPAYGGTATSVAWLPTS